MGKIDIYKWSDKILGEYEKDLQDLKADQKEEKDALKKKYEEKNKGQKTLKD